MVVIGNALQARLIDAARRGLGPSGEGIVRESAERSVGAPLEKLSYVQLPQLFAALERDVPAISGRQTAYAIAEELNGLHDDAEMGLSGRVIGAVGKRMGPAAEPFLANVCTKIGLDLANIDREHLPQLAAAVQQEAGALLGSDIALALATAVEESRSARPPGLVARVIDIARDQYGPQGEELIRDLCRERLEVDLDDLDIDGITLLSRAVERDGPARIGAERTAMFLTMAKQAVASPAEPLRVKILDLARRQIGPAGPDFLKRACTKNGLPFDAVDYEHLMWLAEVIRADAKPLIGQKGADELARNVRNFLTGGR